VQGNELTAGLSWLKRGMAGLATPRRRSIFYRGVGERRRKGARELQWRVSCRSLSPDKWLELNEGRLRSSADHTTALQGSICVPAKVRRDRVEVLYDLSRSSRGAGPARRRHALLRRIGDRG